MCLYFLSNYTWSIEILNRLIDKNTASDYNKLSKILNLCKEENREEIITKTISREGIGEEIVQMFNPEIEFKKKQIISMLYYLGYLTIQGEELDTQY